MYILGINAYHGDAAAAIVKDGELIAAVEEERFNRVKHCAGFPAESVRYCLKAAGVGIEEVQHIGISRDPSAHLHKKVLFAAKRVAKQSAVGTTREIGERGTGKGEGSATHIQETGDKKQEAGGRRQDEEERRQKAEGRKQNAANTREAVSVTEEVETQARAASGNGNGRGFFALVKDRLGNAAKVRDLKGELATALGVSKNSLKAQFHNIEHHHAHLASSFYVSPFERAALLSIDGFGDFVSTMWAVGEGNSIKVLDQVEYPHSTGIVYTATTQFIGFPHYGDEGKVMGLAPYGRPRYIEEFRNIIRTVADGKFKLDLDYFRHHAEGVDMSWDQGSPVIGRIYSDAYSRTFGPPRELGTPLIDRERDIAASLQMRLEEVAFHVLNHLHDETGLTDLGLSGGVAYNSVMNGKILLNTPFRRVYVQPAAGDSGTAVGVCYEIYSRVSGDERSRRPLPSHPSAAAAPGTPESGYVLATDDPPAIAGGTDYKAQRQDVTQSVRLRSDTQETASVIEGRGPQTNSLRYDEKSASVIEGRGPQTNSLRYDEKSASAIEGRGPQTNSLRYDEKSASVIEGRGPQTNSLRYVMEGAYTGPEFSSEEICAELDASGLQYETYTDEDVTRHAAQDIADGLVVGWFQGRMEFGPRALGNRSIVVDPRRADMKETLNERIKKREPFRPFAPSILEERTADYFEQDHPAPTMLMVYQVRPERRAEIPAVTHVDGSGRLQTVSREVNPRYYQLISDFNELTGVPVVLNTSFNENEPIVCTPRHAIDCFLKTRMDVLYLGNHGVRRPGTEDG